MYRDTENQFSEYCKLCIPVIYGIGCFLGHHDREFKKPNEPIVVLSTGSDFDLIRLRLLEFISFTADTNGRGNSPSRVHR